MFTQLGGQFGAQKDHDDVNQQQDASANITHGIATRGNLINLILMSDMRQQRIVKNERTGEPDGAKNIKNAAQQPFLGLVYEEN